jgi:Domain of unknown function (DUF4388)
MSLAGYLSEYSLAEIFHFVQEGNKTGLLSIEPESAVGRSFSRGYELAFQNGRIVSVTDVAAGSKHQSLLEMMEKRRWLSVEQVVGMKTRIASLDRPLGTYLKSIDVITTEQLTLVFNSQVIATICKLFEIHNGQFKFDPQAPLSYGEMTGLSQTANEVALLGLRMLKDWSGLTAKLPTPEFGLQRLSTSPGLRLDTQEANVWNLALGEISISKIAEKLGLEISKVQQIGFRLSAIGLVHEVSIDPPQPLIGLKEAPPVCVGGGNANVPVSASFLSNLMGFLKKKG